MTAPGCGPCGSQRSGHAAKQPRKAQLEPAGGPCAASRKLPSGPPRPGPSLCCSSLLQLLPPLPSKLSRPASIAIITPTASSEASSRARSSFFILPTFASLSGASPPQPEGRFKRAALRHAAANLPHLCCFFPPHSDRPRSPRATRL